MRAGTRSLFVGSSGASLSLGGSESVGSLAGGFNVALGSGTLTTGNDNTSTTYAGVLGGSGALTKLGAGALTLSGSNSYSGITTVSAGELKVNGSTGTGALTVASAAILSGTGTSGGATTISGISNLLLAANDWRDSKNVLLSSVRSGYTFEMLQNGEDVVIEFVPEPFTYALAVIGLGMAGLRHLKKRRAARGLRLRAAA